MSSTNHQLLCLLALCSLSIFSAIAFADANVGVDGVSVSDTVRGIGDKRNMYGIPSRGTWNSLFQSDAQAVYSSDEDFTSAQQAHSHTMIELEQRTAVEQQWHHHQVSKYSFKGKLPASPLIIRFVDEKCGAHCHDLLQKYVGEENHKVINTEYAQIYASHTLAEKILMENEQVLHSASPMLPKLKIESKLFTVANQVCHVTHPITMMVATSYLSSEEADQLKDWLVLYLNDLDPHATLAGNIRSGSNFFTVTSTCQHVMDIATTFANLPQIIWIEQRTEFKPLNRWAKGVCQSGDYSFTPIFSANLTGKGIIIGISDTGLDGNHTLFYDPHHAVPFDTVNHNHRKIISYTTYKDASDPEQGHGTHVCGTAAGNAYTKTGTYYQYNGNAYDAKIAFFDIGDPNEKLDVPSNLNTDLLLVMYNQGARIFSNSWGGEDDGYTTDAYNVDNFMRQYPDALVLFAGGNNGDKGNHTVGTPSINKNGLCVGASLNAYESWNAITGDANKQTYNINNMASFSSKGPTEDNRLKPDILAPGWWTTSSSAEPSAAPNHNKMFISSGTSMATPAVAGIAALVYEYFMRGYYPNGQANETDSFTPSGALVKAVIINAGVPVEKVVTSNGTWYSALSYPSVYQGYGRVQIDTVLNFGVQSSEYTSLFVIGAAEESHPLYASIDSAGESNQYTLRGSSIYNTEPIRITLCYTDVPGAVGSGGLKNDLTMTVTYESGGNTITIHPLLHEDTSLKNGNVKKLYIYGVEDVEYTVNVFATSFNSEQPYALVASGSVTKFDTPDSGDDENEAFRLSAAVVKIIIILSVVIAVLSLILLSIVCCRKKKDLPSRNSLFREDSAVL